MNKKINLFGYLCAIWISTHALNETSTQQKLKVPLPANAAALNLTINLNNHHDSQSNNSTHVCNTQSEVRKNDSPLLNKLSNAFPERPLQSLKDNIRKTDFFDRYKWHALGATVLACYSTLCYLIVSGNAYLGRNDIWSSWRQELPLDQLLAIPQTQFAQELLQEIQRRYNDPSSLIDLAKPLAVFIQTIEKEEEQIKSYQFYYSWLSYLYFLKIVPFSKQRFLQIPQRLQRIAYYKNVFYTWAAQYQLEHAARCEIKRCIADYDSEILYMADSMKKEITSRMQSYWAQSYCIPRYK